ncbi:MAG: prepilin-type N-terminal cleavage/methylation domain-containing protein, partial [Candidatus Sumerlaeota bacterium]
MPFSHILKKGFTLIELLIVVAIIAILAAIAVPNFLEAQTRSKVSRVKADMRSIATAVEAYRIDNNTYPSSTRNVGGNFTVNAFAAGIPAAAGAYNRRAFRIYTNADPNQAQMIT